VQREGGKEREREREKREKKVRRDAGTHAHNDTASHHLMRSVPQRVLLDSNQISKGSNYSKQMNK